MNNMRTRSGLLRSVACAVVGWATLCAPATCAWGAIEGIAAPLYVGNVVPLQDEFGRPMRGSPLAAAAAARPRVEIRVAHFDSFYNDYVAYPPGTNGASSPYNPLVTQTNQYNPTVPAGTVPADSLAGMGLNAAKANSGLFCLVFPKRPKAGLHVFARAYNAPTPGEATFYADSDVVPVPTNGSSVVFAFRSLKALDSADSDGDGLANSWEALLGIDDRATADYDNDGMSDLHEMLAGTAADDATSKLAFRQIRGEPSAQVLAEGETPPRAMRVKWQSVPGKRYQLQYVMTPLGEQVFIDVGEVVAAGEGDYEIDMLVELPADALTGTFRVKLVRE